MDFHNEFSVQAPLDLVWTMMLDARQVAPCVPGAEITEEIDERHFKGTVKVKLGAVQMAYRGELEVEPDEAARTIVLHAKGRETRGSGGATGTFTTTLTGDDNGTHVSIQTRVDVSGRVAQFGRGIMQDVANRMIREFSQCLEARIGDQSASASPPEAPASGTSDGETSRQTTTVNGDPPPTEAVQASPGRAQTAVEQPAPAPAAPPSFSGGPQVAPNPRSPAAELPAIKVSDLLLTVVRGRVAAGLRYLATVLEPK